jgi:hypothetical protein
MAKLQAIGSAFLDGLGSLAFLFIRPVRPGSNEDLIEPPLFVSHPPKQAAPTTGTGAGCP